MSSSTQTWSYKTASLRMLLIKRKRMTLILNTIVKTEKLSFNSHSQIQFQFWTLLSRAPGVTHLQQLHLLGGASTCCQCQLTLELRSPSCSKTYSLKKTTEQSSRVKWMPWRPILYCSYRAVVVAKLCLLHWAKLPKKAPWTTKRFQPSQLKESLTNSTHEQKHQ